MNKQWIYFIIIAIVSIIGAGYAELPEGYYNKVALIVTFIGTFCIGLWGGYYYLLEKIEKKQRVLKSEVEDAI